MKRTWTDKQHPALHTGQNISLALIFAWMYIVVIQKEDFQIYLLNV